MACVGPVIHTRLITVLQTGVAAIRNSSGPVPAARTEPGEPPSENVLTKAAKTCTAVSGVGLPTLATLEGAGRVIARP